jgi:hypothetical protein
MYKHLETIISAGAEKRMVEMFCRNEPQIVESYPELTRSFQAIRLLEELPPGSLLHLHYLRLAEYRNRYDSEGIARYDLYGNSVYFFGNQWLGREVLPFDVVKEIHESRHAKRKIGTYRSETLLRLERIDESLYWPVFWQREKNKLSWVTVKLMENLRAPSDVCPCCGRGKGELKYVQSSLWLIGAVWGIGDECLGDGYVILRVVREDNGKP